MEVKELTVLAITKMHGGVCTAGIDAAGRWVRPIRKLDDTRSARPAITDHCLLPIDFFHGGQSHLVNLGVSRFYLTGSEPHPPHIEDWLIDTSRKPKFIRKLSRDEQSLFLETHSDLDLTWLDPLQVGSLALICPDSFSFRFQVNTAGDDVAVRSGFRIRGKTFSDVGCTDLRMRALGRLLMAGSQDSVELMEQDFKKRGKEALYLAVGLSRLYMDKYWPIVVGVHTIPELDVEIDYARL